MSTNAQRINQTSGEFEYYTPTSIIEAARQLMNGIDLDPFSSPQANRSVQARRFYTIADDGFARPWKCRSLFMNHPFGRTTNARAIEKLCMEVEFGNVRQACVLTYAATSERWFRPMMNHPQCYLFPRTNYLLPNGAIKAGVTKGSVVTYIGHDLTAFRRIFAPLGAVKV